VTSLLDANVLIALAVSDHEHHRAALAWFGGTGDRFATCPITQGALVRLLLREGVPTDQAVRLLQSVLDHPRHEFWPDDLAYPGISWAGVVGHRQVTDAYLAALGRRHRGRLATFDRALAGTHPDVCDLLPT
jgi:hypothetical protein